MSNKYQEALIALTIGVVGEEKMKALMKLQKLVDKATPMKPKKSKTYYGGECFTCPNDSRIVDFTDMCCGYCGQRLEWD